MKVEFDNWDTCTDKSSFILDINCLPIVGEEIRIHKSLFPAHYFTGVFTKNPMEADYDDLIPVTVSIIEHQIDGNGHLPRVCFDVPAHRGDE